MGVAEVFSSLIRGGAFVFSPQNPIGLIASGIQDIHQANVTAVTKVAGGVGGVATGMAKGLGSGLSALNPLHLGKKS